MSSILDTASMYSTYGQSVRDISASSLQGTLGNVNGSTSDDELMSACKNCEAYFVQKIIEEARKTISEEEEEGQGEYMKYFGGLQNEMYANIIAESGSTGLAQQLYDSMKTSL